MRTEGTDCWINNITVTRTLGDDPSSEGRRQKLQADGRDSLRRGLEVENRTALLRCAIREARNEVTPEHYSLEKWQSAGTWWDREWSSTGATACGKNSVHGKIAFPISHICPSFLSLLPDTCGPKNPCISTFHSPTQSKPVTVVWVCAGNKEDLRVTGPSFPQLAQAWPSVAATKTWK